MDKTDLGMSKVPAHIGIIMDGNGRWAKERGKPRLFGHRAGAAVLKNIVRRANDLGIRYLSVYAFSTENNKRPEEEVSGIFKLFVLYMEKELAELFENGVKINVIGDLQSLPSPVRSAAENAMEKTSENRGMQFNIALNYGGRADVASAAARLAKRVKDGTLDISEIDEDALSKELSTAGMPDPDLIIRTGGEYRLSNFLIWQSAYSELYFTPVYWPDFTPEMLDEAVFEYKKRDRRYGGVK